MQLRTVSLLSALLLPLVAAPAIALGSSSDTATAPKTIPTKPSDGAVTQVPPGGGNPAPGTCTVDNTDANYTCTTCTSPGGGVITVTCVPKVKKPPIIWW
jgi:hypothetical protein